MCFSLGSGSKAIYHRTACVPTAKLSCSLKQGGHVDHLLGMACGPCQLLDYVQELVGKVLIDPSQNHARGDFKNFMVQTTQFLCSGMIPSAT